VRVGLLLHGARPTRHDRPGDMFQLFGAAHAAEAGAFDIGTVVREAALPEPLRRRERRLFSMTVAVPAGAW